MPRTRFKLNPSDVRRIEQALDPRVFRGTIRRHVAQATKRNGKLAEAIVRQTIRAGVPPPNAALTVAIKGSNKPLVDHGTGIFQAVTSKAMSATEVFVGVLRTSEAFNIAATIHNGATIRVTDKMRGMFYVLWLASQGSIKPGDLEGRAAELFERMPTGWKPLKASTTHIVIPERPFMRIAFRNPRLLRQARANWRQAVNTAMRELARRGGR